MTMTSVDARPAGPAAPPRWARRAALLAALTPVPSAIWRLSFAVGLPVGADTGFRETHYGFPGWGTAYLVGLTLLLAGLALLTFGLVRPWGEMLPTWMPFVGGRRVPPLAAIIAAGTGALALTLLLLVSFSNFGDIFAIYGLDGAERVVVLACYAPMLLWGPLLAAVTVSYAKRTGWRCQLASRRSAPPPV
ncbi:hypothetical protein BH20ACT2_BH20ACT2_21590 [soil metagenome]